MKNAWRHALMCLVLGIIAASTWWPRAGGPIDLRWDGGAYYILGTSLAEGKGYRLLSEPGNIRTTLHPPFLPVLVAAHQLVLKSSDPIAVGQALRFTTCLFAIAYAIAIYWLLSAYIPRIYAFTAALIGVLQPQYIYFADSLYAETFFGLFTLLFFIFHGGRFVSYRLFYYLPFGKAFDEALDWLHTRAGRTDVIAATDPQWVYLRTGRKAVLPPFELNANKAQQLVDTVPVKYLIAETTAQTVGLGAYHRYTSVLVRENPNQWVRIWSSSNGSISIFERSDIGQAAVQR